MSVRAGPAPFCADKDCPSETQIAATARKITPFGHIECLSPGYFMFVISSIDHRATEKRRLQRSGASSSDRLEEVGHFLSRCFGGVHSHFRTLLSAFRDSGSCILRGMAGKFEGPLCAIGGFDRNRLGATIEGSNRSLCHFEAA